MKNHRLPWLVVPGAVVLAVSLAAAVQRAATPGFVPGERALERLDRARFSPVTGVRPPGGGMRAPVGVAGRASAAALASAPVTVYQDDFEGDFPGPWAIYVGGPQAFWGSSTTRAFAGTKSVYCAAGGTQAVPPGGPYLASMNAWMVYGPFSLADATAGSATFRFWLQSESAKDYFQFMVSTDNNQFYGYQTSGDSGGWQSATLDLADPSLPITVMGQAQVWFAFIFTSDAATQFEGAYVDAVTISKAACTLDCNATVPATAQAAVPVSFQATATPSACAGSVSYAWDFGDQAATSSDQNPSHTYAAAGTYSWQMTATIGGQSCVKNGSITVSAPAVSTYTYWLGVASHAPGLKGSQWRTDMGVLNLAAATANVELRFHGGASVLTSDITIASGAQSILKDVVGLFSFSGSGALELVSDQPLYVTSRTYNQAASGTFGQGYDGFTASQGLATGQVLYLLELAENAAYRANIGLTNLGDAAAIALVELFDGAGAKLSQYTVNLAAGQWKQETQPFKTKAGQTNLGSGYAKVTVTQGSGVIAYASVIDNLTNDATTIPMKRGISIGTQYWLQVASHAPGLKGSQWRTDLAILNLAGVTANLQLRYHGTSVPPSVNAVASGSQLVLKDVVNLFGVSGSGALEVLSDQQLYVTSRTYNQAASGTFGQEYDGFTVSQGLWPGQTLYLLELTENAAYRANIGLTNLGSIAAVALVELFDGAGTKLGEYTVNLDPGEWSQETQPFKNKAGQTSLASGYAKVTVSEGAGVVAYASVIDNVTNDATTIPMKRPFANAISSQVSLNWISSRVVGQLGGKLPSLDTIVASVISGGVAPLLNDLAAGDPTHRLVLPDGIKFDYGTGTLIRGANVTGSVTFTYSNGNRTATGFSANFAGAASSDFAVDGAKYPIKTLTGSVSATQTTTPPPAISAWDLGFLHVRRQAITATVGDVTIVGTGDDPPSAVTGNIHFDTAKCPKGYPTAGTIDKTVGSDRIVITFGDQCDGSIGFQINPPGLPCNAGQQVAGGDAPDSRSFEMGTKSATFRFDFETYSIEDQIQVLYEGEVIFDTGCVGNFGSVNVTYSGQSTVIQVNVIPNCKGNTSGTAWDYQVFCPQ